MRVKFNNNTVLRFTIYGILFGICFPLFSCITFCTVQEGGFTFSKAFELHRTNLLQQVIDLAPFILGFMGYLIGSRQKSIEDSKKKIEELFEVTEKFYPVKFLQFLRKDSHFVSLGDNIEIEATILFTDIRGFTSLSEKLTPKEVMDFVNEYLAVCIPIIEKYGGIIDKFIGDSIMVIYPTSPEMALDSVIEMKKALDAYNEKRLLAGKQIVRTGFGLHFGKLALGTIGTEQRMQTTVLGDAVNLASRVEGLTKEFKTWILMTGDFAIKVAQANKFHIREIDIAKVRGKENSVPIYECYDADDAGIISLKDSYKFDLIMAMNAYREEEFSEAEVSLKEIASINPADPIPMIYLNRCQEKKRETRELYTKEKWGALVVDDNEVILHILDLYLRKENFEIVTQMNGILALSSFDNFLPQVVFLDYNLPDLNGIDVAILLKEKIQSKNLDTKIILMTAEDPDPFEKYIQDGIIDAFLQKPFQEKHVKQTLEKFLNRKL